MSIASQTILQRIASGDQSAMQAGLDHYGGLVWSLARRFSADRTEAEDATQEIFVDLWKNAAQFDPARGSETTFVSMLARRRLIDRYRKRSREGSLSASPGGMDPSDSSESPGMVRIAASSGGGSIEISEEAQLAAQVLESLGDEQRRVLRLSIHHGWSHERIAEATGLPLGTVKTHLRRGLIRVREILGSASTSARQRMKGGIGTRP